MKKLVIGAKDLKDFKRYSPAAGENELKPYTALDTKSGFMVLIKYLKNSKDSLAKAEVDKWLTLNHENVLPLNGSFKAPNGGISVSCEIPFSADLRTRINAKKSEDKYFTEKQTLQILAKTAKGLSYMHSLNMAHRDVKPDNVYFSEDNILKLGNPLLPCKSFTPSDIQSNYKTSDLGTLAYLAPEVLKSLKASKDGSKMEVSSSYDEIKADCWAFGVFVYELCTFKLPFSFDNLEEFIKELPNPDLKVPSVKVNPAISAET
jgi:serine/threonine protein kinase